MIIDCHVHAVAGVLPHGLISQRLLRQWNFRFIRRRLGLRARSLPELEKQAEAKLVDTVNAAEMLDAVVALAFDAVYDEHGVLDAKNTHLYVGNQYVYEMTRKHPKLVFGASVHPYRTDAIAELERCVNHGAVLMKWLPIVQNFNPADDCCLPFYDALVQHRLPLLCHTGGESALPNLNAGYADPALLVPALRRGVTVVAAHCGTRDFPWAPDYLPAFVRLVHEYENLYGDTAALNLPTRSYAYDTILHDDVVRNRLVHGSDWPIISVPTRRIGWWAATRLLFQEKNWLRRDVLVKQQLGLDDAYWQRAATLLRLPKPSETRAQAR